MFVIRTKIEYVLAFLKQIPVHKNKTASVPKSFEKKSRDVLVLNLNLELLGKLAVEQHILSRTTL